MGRANSRREQHSRLSARAKNNLASFFPHGANLPSTVFFLKREAMSLLCINLITEYASCTVKPCDSCCRYRRLAVSPGRWVSLAASVSWLTFCCRSYSLSWLTQRLCVTSRRDSHAAFAVPRKNACLAGKIVLQPQGKKWQNVMCHGLYVLAGL